MAHCTAFYILLLCSSLVKTYGECDIEAKFTKVQEEQELEDDFTHEGWLNYVTQVLEKSRSIFRKSDLKCLEYTLQTWHIIDQSEVEERSFCEFRYVKETHFKVILDGVAAELREFTHSAAIGWARDEDYVFLCGGSIISSRFVITAAHCAKYNGLPNPDPVIVRLGTVDIKPSTERGLDVQIKKIFIYPLYTPKRKYNDVALIELQREIRFGKEIRPACLWTSNGFCNNTKAVAIGWGVTNSSTEKKADTLQKVTLDLIENKECNITRSQKFDRKWNGFSDSQICAGDLQGHRDTCQGDSGSPLQIVSEKHECMTYILGITSTGNSYCGTGPSVYTKVSSFLDWIESIVWEDEF